MTIDCSNGKETTIGEAFEYACLSSIQSLNKGSINILKDDSFDKIERAFYSVPLDEQATMIKSASHAVELLSHWDAHFCCSTGRLFINVQSSNSGLRGDPRDLVCSKEDSPWETGISCKHNHNALKQPRLSMGYDFGKEWLGIPCSPNYFDHIYPVFSKMEKFKNLPWSQIDSKNISKREDIYMPVLSAFRDELLWLCNDAERSVPTKLLKYVLGRYDYYRIICDTKIRATTI